MSFDFTGKVVMITGAGGNLGAAVTRAFLAAGAHVVPTDRTADRLPALFSEIATTSDHLLAGGIDLTDPAAVAGLMARVMERFGRLDVLINAAGGFRADGPVHQTALETLDLMLSINLRTAFVASQAVIPIMLAQGSGRIVNVASRAALIGTRNVSAYSASKAAVVRLTESLSAELRDSGINVNCVLPSIIDSAANRAEMPNADPSKWVAPESLAEVILFLASEAARDVHGAALPVYGRS